MNTNDETDLPENDNQKQEPNGSPEAPIVSETGFLIYPADESFQDSFFEDEHSHNVMDEDERIDSFFDATEECENSKRAQEKSDNDAEPVPVNGGDDTKSKIEMFQDEIKNIDKNLSDVGRAALIRETLELLVKEANSDVQACFKFVKDEFKLNERDIEAFRKDFTALRNQQETQEKKNKLRSILEKFEQKPKELSEGEKQQALAYLKDPNLIDNISRDLTNAGEIIGEHTNKMMLYLAAVSRKFDKPISLVIFGKSSSGKSFLANAIEKFIPDEDKLVLSSSSQQAFNYLGEQLKHKFVLIQEWEGIEGILPTIRTLQSEGKLSRLITVKDPEDGSFKARADCQLCPCTVIFTTTRETIHDENSTRIFELYADERLGQNRKVVDRTIHKSDIKYRNNEAQKKQILGLHQDTQRILEPIEISIPFAEHLSFPAKSTRNRRDIERFIQLIKTVAFLRQKQKEIKIYNGEKYIEADEYDYEVAFKIGINVIASTLDQISERARNVLRVCCELTDDLKKGGENLWFTIKQLREKAPSLGLEFSSNLKDLYKQLDILTEHEYLDLNQPQARGKKHYCVSFDYVRGFNGEIMNIGTPEIKEITTPDALRQKLLAN